MSDNFKSERDADFRKTVIYRTGCGDADAVLAVPDKLWSEFVGFVRDLGTEMRVRRWVRDEYVLLRRAEQARCDHARSAKLVDAPTGLLRCDDCGAEFRCTDEAGPPSPEQLAESKAEAAKFLTRRAGGPPRS